MMRTKKNETTNNRPFLISNNSLTLLDNILEKAAPPPLMTVSEWADSFRQIPNEYGAEPGKWVSKDYQIPIMDAFTSAGTTKVVAMLGAQLGKSELLFNLLGRFIHLDPCPMLMVQPTVDDSKDFSKERLMPTVSKTPVLAERIHEQKSRNSDNTILKKLFPGGYLALVGSNAPSGLAKRSIRVLVCDEVDRFAMSAGTEGDPVKLAEKRTSNFWNHLVALFSTPTDKASRIYREYKLGTQEEWRYECPNCHEWHWLTMDDMKIDYDEYETDGKKSYNVRDVHWVCPDCGFAYNEIEMRAAKQGYVTLNPGVSHTRSFHVNAFTSPWIHWTSIANEYLEAQEDEETLKTFINTRLAEIYSPDSNVEDIEPLLARREPYDADLPDGVLLLTAAVDTQNDRLEYEIAGWGKGEERWGIKKGILLGAPDKDSPVWEDLDRMLDRDFYFADGRCLRVARTFIDSGGSYTEEVYHYCMERQHMGRFPIKGAHGFGVPVLYKTAKAKNYPGLSLVMLGVNDGKEYIMQRLKTKVTPGPQYLHFPDDDERGYDKRYFHGLLAEKLILVKKRGGLQKAWVNVAPDKRNEPIDLQVYNFACMRSIDPDWAVYDEIINGNKQEEPKKERKQQYGCISKGITV